MTELVLYALGVLFCWEFLTSLLGAVLPWSIPSLLQPLIVVGAALGFAWPDWRLALAVSGAVGILHFLTREASTPQQMVQRPRRRPGVPPLP